MLGSFASVRDALAERCEPKSHTGRLLLRLAIQATDTPRFMVLVDLAEKTAEPCTLPCPRARYNALSARLQSGLHLLFVVSSSSYRSGSAILICHQNPVVLA